MDGEREGGRGGSSEVTCCTALWQWLMNKESECVMCWVKELIAYKWNVTNSLAGWLGES